MNLIISGEQRNLSLVICLDCAATVGAPSQLWGAIGSFGYAGLFHLDLAIAVIHILRRICHVFIRLESNVIRCDIRVEHPLQG